MRDELANRAQKAHGRVKCRLGLHDGKVLTAEEIKEQHDETIFQPCAFVCSRCSAVIE